MQLSPQSSSMTLSFLTVNFTAKFQREQVTEMASNERGVGKIHNFQPISRRISDTVQDRTTKVAIND